MTTNEATMRRVLSILKKDDVQPLTIAKVFCVLNGTTIGAIAASMNRSQHYLHRALVYEVPVTQKVRCDVKAALGIDPWS